MRWVLAIPVAVHGLIHLMGFARAFGFAEMPGLRITIARPVGLLWLAAAVSMLATAFAFVAMPRTWWILAFGAVVVSQTVIATSWSDARFGTLANVFVLLLAVHGLASQGPWSLTAAYRAAVAKRLEPAAAAPAVVTEADLQSVPLPVQRYLRVTGAVGEPRIESACLRWSGRIRSAPDESWMPFEAEQFLFVDEPARQFLMEARRSGLPVDVLHLYGEGRARMDVRLLSMVPLLQQRGDELDRTETGLEPTRWSTAVGDDLRVGPRRVIGRGEGRWHPEDGEFVYLELDLPAYETNVHLQHGVR